MNIKKNDTVKIILGKDRGKSGKVMEVFPKRDTILVEGLNLVKKHQRPRREGEKGTIVTIPRPLKASKIMLICATCHQAVRVGYRFEGDKKLRICKKCKGNF